MLIGNRIVYYSFELAEGRTDELVNLLRAQRKRVTIIDNQQITVQFPPGEDFVCGLTIGAGPVDQAQSLMFALFGPYWAMGLNKEYAEAQKQIGVELKKRRKKQNLQQMRRTKPARKRPLMCRTK